MRSSPRRCARRARSRSAGRCASRSPAGWRAPGRARRPRRAGRVSIVAQQPAATVRAEHADAGDAAGRQPGATGHERVEAVAGDVADATLAIPGRQRVGTLPRRDPLGLGPLLVARSGRASGRSITVALASAVLLRRGGADLDPSCRPSPRSSHSPARYRPGRWSDPYNVRAWLRRRGGRGRRCRSTGGAACSSPAPRSGGCARG